MKYYSLFHNETCSKFLSDLLVLLWNVLYVIALQVYPIATIHCIEVLLYLKGTVVFPCLVSVCFTFINDLIS